MSRYPPIPPSELNDGQKELQDEMDKIAKGAFQNLFEHKRPDGAFVGPFATLLHTPPQVARAWFSIQQALASIPDLPQQTREVAILTVGSHFKAAYELYSHEKIAAHNTHLTDAQVDSIKAGRDPGDLGPADKAAFDLALATVKNPGPLKAEIFEAARKELGETGTLVLIHFVGFYCYVCALLNGADVPLPDGEKIRRG